MFISALIAASFAIPLVHATLPEHERRAARPVIEDLWNAPAERREAVLARAAGEYDGLDPLDRMIELHRLARRLIEAIERRRPDAARTAVESLVRAHQLEVVRGNGNARQLSSQILYVLGSSFAALAAVDYGYLASIEAPLLDPGLLALGVPAVPLVAAGLAYGRDGWLRPLPGTKRLAARRGRGGFVRAFEHDLHAAFGERDAWIDATSEAGDPSANVLAGVRALIAEEFGPAALATACEEILTAGESPPHL